MGELTRAEYQLLFERLLGHARASRANQANGGPGYTAEEIADRARAGDALAARLTRRQAIREANRAINANEAAAQARLNPQAQPRRADIPFQRGIYNRESEYQYRVVVTTLTNGRPDPGGLLIKFGSGELLTGEQIMARALREHAKLPATTYTVYPTALNPVTSGRQYTAIPIAIGRFEPQ